MIEAVDLQAKHQAGLTYDQYLRSGTAQQQADWTSIHQQTKLTEAQRALLGGFRRQLNVIVLSGIWCGDCVQQGPLLAHIAEANPEKIVMRWLDRDQHADLQQRVMINAGRRVPVALFCAEDFEWLGAYGDRTLSRYRAMAQKRLGSACPLPGASVPDDELAATLADWVDEFERFHLMLRLSARLRQKHGD